MKSRQKIASQKLWSITKKFATLPKEKTGQPKRIDLIERYEKEEATLEKMKIEDIKLKESLLERRKKASELETDWRCDLASNFIEVERKRSSL